MNGTEGTIGRAKLALVFGGEGNRQGVLSTVAIRARSRQKGRPLVFQGPVKFAESTVAHITSVILPTVDRILAALGVRLKTFEISAANIGAASCHDLGIEISGLSADLPVVLSLLSAALQMPIRDDFVATGHLASTHGDISAVKGIAAKLAVALADRSIRRFIYGDLQKDRSLDDLSPHEKDTAVAAIIRASNAINTKAVHGIDELLAEAFTEHAILANSLQNGFFHISCEADGVGDPVTQAIDLLTRGNDQRFWRLLHSGLSTGECEGGVHLLETYVTSFLGRGQYPQGFGARLLRLLCALPPAIRRLKLKYPLLDFGRCIELVRLASPGDFADVPVLFDAVRGKVPGEDRFVIEQESPPASRITDCGLFDAVTAEIREESLTRQFDISIDSARASFVLASSTARSYDDFLGIVESFFIHLQSHLDPETATASDLQQARKDALRLLGRAFWEHGGLRGAWVRAQAGIDGGVRSVLDAMTERYKAEKRAEHIETVLEVAIKGMDRADQVRFARGAMARLGPLLPAELKEQPPERFAHHAGEIARAYVKSIASIERLLQMM